MIQALLVDDEVNNIENLQALLNKHCPEINIVAYATSADQAQTLIPDLKPEVIFLDIHMPGKDGFGLLKSLPDHDFEVVFITAYDEYALMAIKFSALDYLLKPISIAELKMAVSKIVAAVANRKQNLRLENLLHLLNRQQRDDHEKIALPTIKETFLVPIKNVVRCESSNNYTRFFLVSGGSHLISKPIYEYEKLLEPYGFIRCHQSHLVNRNYITSILNEDTGYLVMDYTPAKIPVSKQKKILLKTFLKA